MLPTVVYPEHWCGLTRPRSSPAQRSLARTGQSKMRPHRAAQNECGPGTNKLTISRKLAKQSDPCDEDRPDACGRNNSNERHVCVFKVGGVREEAATGTAAGCPHGCIMCPQMQLLDIRLHPGPPCWLLIGGDCCGSAVRCCCGVCFVQR